MMSQAWCSEIGLMLDLVAFAMLSLDLVHSMRGERLARDEIQKLERESYDRRYGVFAPAREVIELQDAEFAEAQRERVRSSDNDMRKRRWLAYAAIAVSLAGFAMQLYGGWPK